MKTYNKIKNKIVLLLLMMSTILKSQSASNDKYQSVIDKIKTTYNDKNYKGFYNLLSDNFKTQMTETDLSNFLKDNLYTYLGTIKSVSFDKEKDGARFYNTQFEKGNLDLMLVCNKDLLIDGLSFEPHKEEIISSKIVVSDNKKQKTLDLKIDSIVTEFISNPINAGLSIGVIQNGTTFFYHYGETKKESHQLPSNQTIYEIGSVSKTFTGILLAQAIIDKKITLEDDIRKFLPVQLSKLDYKGHPIKIKHLVNHTSTIPRIPENLDKQPNYDSLNPYKNYTKAMMYDYLKNLPLDEMPGIVQDYSNTGMALLGIILENAYQQSYGKLLQTYITTPFNMNNTVVNVSKTQMVNFADGYNDMGVYTTHWDLGDLVGAGGIKSTIEDMTLYLKENISENDSITALSHKVSYQKDKKGAGLAWVIQPTKSGNTLIWHNGGTYGFTSFCGFIKEKKCGVVVLSNSGNGVDDIAISILKYLQK